MRDGVAEVVVVGGGYGGLAAALRLAKLGHRVTLVEGGERVGGALVPVEQDGYTWDGSATYTLLPAVLRDLFRKTGRPLEAELDLVPLATLREHRWPDATSLVLPGALRQAQRVAVEGLGPGLGEAWLAYVDEQATTWDVLRRGYLEAPWDQRVPRRHQEGTAAEVAAVLDDRETLRHRLRRAFRDDRLVDVAAHHAVMDGHDPRNVPGWAGVVSYLEQAFGGWRVVGGTARLLAALVARLETRGVSVLTGTTVEDLVVREGRVAAVATSAGVLEAQVVVCAVDPRRLPALAPLVRRSMPALPAYAVHVGLEHAPDLDHELVVHGDPMISVRPGGTAPPGCSAWTLHGRGQVAEDLLATLARQHLDLRDRVVTRVDRSPRDLVEAWGGSPLGVLWEGRGTARRRLGPRTPVRGVYAAGAHATPGSGLPFVGLSAALVAGVVHEDLTGRPPG